MYELREALEVYAVGKAAAQRIGRRELDRLQELADSISDFKIELQRSGSSALNPEQMHRLRTYDLSFHTLLVHAAATTRILKVFNETRLLTRIFSIHRDGHTIPVLDQIHRQHYEVVRCVAGQNREGAMRALSAHIQASP